MPVAWEVDPALLPTPEGLLLVAFSLPGTPGQGEDLGLLFHVCLKHRTFRKSVLCLAQDTLLFSESSNIIMFCSVAILFI